MSPRERRAVPPVRFELPSTLSQCIFDAFLDNLDELGLFTTYMSLPFIKPRHRTTIFFNFYRRFGVDLALLVHRIAIAHVQRAKIQ